jgi:hypothetical protein
MNINMKKKYLKMAFFCLFTVVALSSCNKDEDEGSINTITAVVENGSSYNALIDVVKLEVESSSSSYELKTLTDAEYKDGGFTIILPESVSSQYLELPFGDDDDIIPKGITVSNKNAKGASAYLIAYKSNKLVGEFYLESGDWSGGLIYIDSDVSITGTATETETWEGETYTEKFNYSVNLKRGWNMVYTKITENSNNFVLEATTTAPSGAKWYFYFSAHTTMMNLPYPAHAPKRLYCWGKQKVRF